MNDLYSNLNILTAMTRLEPELPYLIGETWANVQEQVSADLDALRRSQSGQEQELIAERLIDQMSRFQKAQRRLNSELYIQEAVKNDIEYDIGNIRNDLRCDDQKFRASLHAMAFGLRWLIDPDDIPSQYDLETRTITLNPGGVSGGKSIKFSNLSLDFGEMSAIASSGLLTGYEIIKDPNGFVIAAGVLAMISILFKAATVQINEQDASVYWGFIQIRDKKDNTATETDVIASTNQERNKYQREKLKEKDIQLSLTNLQALKSIVPVEGHPERWKLIESFKIKL
jgi:hypothetical protein